MILNKIVCLLLSSLKKACDRKFDIAALEGCSNDRNIRAKLEKYITESLK